MKLRNLLYATMIACAFASCSKDEVIPTPGTEPEAEGDATLSLQVFGSVDTKSNPFGTAVTDSTINTLTAYVFRSSDGSTTNYVFEKSQAATNASDKKVEKIPVTAGMKKVIVLANATATLTAGTSTLENLCAQTLTYSTAEVNGLSMNSAVYTLYVKAGEENCLGYTTKPTGAIDATVSAESATAVATSPIYLYRNVAKVMLSEVKMKTGSEAKYPNASLKIDSVYILHARKYSNLAANNSISGQGWGATAVKVDDVANYLNGVSGGLYQKWATLMNGKAAVKKYFETATNNYDVTAVTSLGEAVSNFTATKTSSVSKVDSFYVYENPAVQGGDTTLLVVVGKFYPDGNTNATNVDYSYYTVGIGTDGLGSIAKPAGTLVSRDIAGVLRNLEYRISLTVNGPGYETPFGPKLDDYTFLDVECVVAPFGTVDQSVEI